MYGNGNGKGFNPVEDSCVGFCFANCSYEQRRKGMLNNVAAIFFFTNCLCREGSEAV